MDGIQELASTPSAELLDRLSTIEKHNSVLQQTVNDMQKMILSLEERLNKLTVSGGVPTVTHAKASQAQPTAAKAADDDDDGVDLFGSDSEVNL